MAAPVESAYKYVQQQAVVGADETSWVQGNADGRNPSGIKAWLWVAVTPLVTCFQVLLSRSQEAAQTLLWRNLWGHPHLRPPWGIQLGRSGAAAAVLGALEARIHQDIRATWSFGAVGSSTG